MQTAKFDATAVKGWMVNDVPFF